MSVTNKVPIRQSLPEKFGSRRISVGFSACAVTNELGEAFSGCGFPTVEPCSCAPRHIPPHPVSFKDPPKHVSMGFEGNRMPARADRNPTEIRGEGSFGD